jgi:hypothetical protein
MSGKAISAKAQRQNAQLRPIACARCRLPASDDSVSDDLALKPTGRSHVY